MVAPRPRVHARRGRRRTPEFVGPGLVLVTGGESRISYSAAKISNPGKAGARRLRQRGCKPTGFLIGYRANNALCAHDDPIVKPRDAGEIFQYEGELVAVIGRQGRKIPADKALDHVFGWTIGNDVSERTWQRGDRTMWRAKNADSFKPMGPWIVTGVDYRKMTTVVRLNGEEVDRFATANMIHDVETYIAEVSRYCTLYPGDVMWMGTDGSPRNMKPGTVCEVEITGIGTLRNKVVEEG